MEINLQECSPQSPWQEEENVGVIENQFPTSEFGTTSPAKKPSEDGEEQTTPTQNISSPDLLPNKKHLSETLAQLSDSSPNFEQLKHLKATTAHGESFLDEQSNTISPIKMQNHGEHLTLGLMPIE